MLLCSTISFHFVRSFVQFFHWIDLSVCLSILWVNLQAYKFSNGEMHLQSSILLPICIWIEWEKKVDHKISPYTKTLTYEKSNDSFGNEKKKSKRAREREIEENLRYNNKIKEPTKTMWHKIRCVTIYFYTFLAIESFFKCHSFDWVSRKKKTFFWTIQNS